MEPKGNNVTEPAKLPSLIKRTPWQLIALLLLLAAGLAGAFLAPHPLIRAYLRAAVAFHDARNGGLSHRHKTT